MKNILLILSVLGISFIGCSDSESPIISSDNSDTTSQTSSLVAAPDFDLDHVNRPVFFEYTSTGCPGCGSWGKPTFENLIRQHGADIIPMAVHIKYGDKMITPVSEAIASNRTGQFYTPQLWVNNTNGMVLNSGRIDGMESINQMNAAIAAAQAGSTKVSVGVSSVISNDSLKLRYKTKSNVDLSGQEIYVGLYVMENALSYNQSGSAANPTVHNHVIRTSNAGGFGKALDASLLAKEAEMEETFSFELNENWNKENLYIAIIIWEKVGNTYQVVNANSSMTKN
jgi:hypothetical protein